MEESLSELLTKQITEADALRNVAQCVIDLTTVKRFHNGRNRSRTYNGDIDAIAGAARQLAEMAINLIDTATPTNEVLMPHYPVLQPDGLLAIWSTIVDDFTCFNCTPIEAAEELMTWHKDETARALSLCDRVAKGDIPFPYWRTWEDRVTLAILRHGRDEETVQYALEITPDCTRIDAMVAENLSTENEPESE